MKIRFDFVTNSSSTSFVVICKGRPDKGVFLSAMGVKKDSPLRAFFEELFEVLNRKMTNAKGPINSRYWQPAENIVALVERELSKAAAQRAKKALGSGQDVWIGKLNSDEGGVEAFFCCESFEIDHPHLHVDAVCCTW